MSLDDLAVRINGAWTDMENSSLHAHLLIGRMLVEAQEKHKREGRNGSFEQWCTQYIKSPKTGRPRNFRNIQKMMAMARSEDPKAALAKAQESDARRMRRARAEKRRSLEAEGGGEHSPPIPALPKTAKIGKTVIEIGALSPMAQQQIAEQLADTPPPEPACSRYVRTPPETYNPLNMEFQFDCDPCPHPRPAGYDALTVDWPGKVIFLNGPFRDTEGDGGPTAFARKAIEEHHKGKTIVGLWPVASYVNMLLEAGAEIRSIGRVAWLDKDGNQMPGPTPIACFVLRANQPETAVCGDAVVLAREAVFEKDHALVVMVPAGSTKSDALKLCEAEIVEGLADSRDDPSTRLDHIEKALATLSAIDEQDGPFDKANPPEVIALPALQPSMPEPTAAGMNEEIHIDRASQKPLPTQVVEQIAVEHRFCSLGKTGCQHPRRCREERRCAEAATTSVRPVGHAIAARQAVDAQSANVLRR